MLPDNGCHLWIFTLQCNERIVKMTGKTKKATFNLHTDVLDELDQMMANGIASSKNALVEQALRKEMKEIKRQTRKTLWQEAAKDPVFMKDIADIENDFKYADAETIGSID
jgi:predicted transcriptional regulator